MSAIYDRHEYIKDLTDAGLNERQAEAIAKGTVEVLQNTLATKEDIAKLEASTKENIAGLEVRLTNKMYGLAFGTVTLTVALIKLLP